MYSNGIFVRAKGMSQYLKGKKLGYRIRLPKLHARRCRRKGDFLNQKGFGTVEVVILIAVVVGIALLFRTAIIDFAEAVIDNMFPSDTGVFDNSSL